jgi:hypothetical protein
MPDTITVGENFVAGHYAWRWSVTEPVVKKAVATITTCTIALTKPDGTVTTTLIGSLLNPEPGRYELTASATLAGDYIADWTVAGTYTDENGVARNYAASPRGVFKVQP